MSPLASHFQKHGFAIVPECLSAKVVARLLNRLEHACEDRSAQQSVSNSSGVYALRNLTDVVPEVQELLSNPALVDTVCQILGRNAFMVRATLFDKTEGANWGIFWHQDLSIAVREKHDVPGFSAWTRKAGVVSVQPPVEMMSRILAVRLHLDDCTVANGALRVLPGTHHGGRLAASSVGITAQEQSCVVCEVPSGGAMLMNPLTLHSSSPMDHAGHRRVIHFEFANFQLPEPLEWQYRLSCSPAEP